MYALNRSVILSILYLIFSTNTSSAIALGTDRWVSVVGTDSGDCTKKLSPCRSIQYAIDAAAKGDTVNVSNGTYEENINFKGKAIAVRSLYGSGKTAIYGSKAASVVVFDNGEMGASVLDGFTIAHGSSVEGGGIYIRGSAPTIVNCTISGNKASADGGGIYNFEASPTISRCIITGNMASVDGGGIYSYSSSPTITDCTINKNSAGYAGGGILNVLSSADITGSTITGNMAGTDGGGFYVFRSSPTITECNISGNFAEREGGGIKYAASSLPVLRGCNISGNLAEFGSGIYASDSSPAITNCTINGNAAAFGGGMYNYNYSSPSITNSTISGNSSERGGAIYNHEYSSGTVINSILWANSPDEVMLGISSSINVEYSNVQDHMAGTGNLSMDPLFVNPRPASEAPTVAGDYHLQQNSPCIDSGTADTSTYPTIPSDDIDGDPRPQGAGYDMGSDEYVGEPMADDICVFREGAWLFYDFDSGTEGSGVWTGSSPGCIPAPIDHDGDGVWEFSQLCDGAWHFYNDDGSYLKGIWTGGVSGDLPVPADYDGDGTEDVVVFRDGAWLAYDFATGDSSWSVWTGSPAHWTGGTPVPVPMDYDGDGAADLTVYSGGPWHFFNYDGSYNMGIWTGGVTGDMPVAADYYGDGSEDVVVFRGGAWLAYDIGTGLPSWSVWTGSPAHWTGGTSLPAPLDYDGDGSVDLTVYSGGPWHFYDLHGNYSKGIWTGGVPGDQPISRRLLP